MSGEEGGQGAADIWLADCCPRGAPDYLQPVGVPCMEKTRETGHEHKLAPGAELLRGDEFGQTEGRPSLYHRRQRRTQPDKERAPVRLGDGGLFHADARATRAGKRTTGNT